MKQARTTHMDTFKKRVEKAETLIKNLKELQKTNSQKAKEKKEQIKIAKADIDRCINTEEMSTKGMLEVKDINKEVQERKDLIDGKVMSVYQVDEASPNSENSMEKAVWILGELAKEEMLSPNSPYEYNEKNATQVFNAIVDDLAVSYIEKRVEVFQNMVDISETMWCYDNTNKDVKEYSGNQSYIHIDKGICEVSNNNEQYIGSKGRFNFRSIAHVVGSVYGFHCIYNKAVEDMKYLNEETGLKHSLMDYALPEYNEVSYGHIARGLLHGYAPTFIGATAGGSMVATSFPYDYMYAKSTVIGVGGEQVTGASIADGIFTYACQRDILSDEIKETYIRYFVQIDGRYISGSTPTTLDKVLQEEYNANSENKKEVNKVVNAQYTEEEKNYCLTLFISNLLGFYNIGLKPSMALRNFSYNSTTNQQNNLKLCQDTTPLTHLSFGVAHVGVVPFALSGYTSKGMVTFNVDLRPAKTYNDEYFSIFSEESARAACHFKVMLNNKQKLTFNGYADFYNEDGIGMSGITKKEATKLGDIWKSQFYSCMPYMPIQTFTLPQLTDIVNSSGAQDDIVLPMLTAIKEEVEYNANVMNRTIKDIMWSQDTNAFFTSSTINDHYACVSMSAIQRRIKRLTGFAPALNIIKMNLNKWGLTSTAIKRQSKKKVNKDNNKELITNPYQLDEAPKMKNSRGNCYSKLIKNTGVLGNTYSICPEHCHLISDKKELEKPFALQGTFYKLLTLDSASSSALSEASVVTAFGNISVSSLESHTMSKAKNVDATVAIHVERLMGLFSCGLSPLPYLSNQHDDTDVFTYEEGETATEILAIQQYRNNMDRFTEIFTLMTNHKELEVFSLPNYRQWVMETQGLTQEDMRRENLLMENPTYIHQLVHNMAGLVCVHNAGSILSSALNKKSDYIDSASRILAVLELCKKMETTRRNKTGIITSKNNKITINVMALRKLITAKSDAQLAQILQKLNLSTKIFGIDVVETQVSYLISLGVTSKEIDQFVEFTKNVKGTYATELTTNEGLTVTNTMTFDYSKVYNTITKTLAGAVATLYGISLVNGKKVVRYSHACYRQRINDFMRMIGMTKIELKLKEMHKEGNVCPIVTLETTIKEFAQLEEKGAFHLADYVTQDLVVCPVEVDGEDQILVTETDSMMNKVDEDIEITSFGLARKYFMDKTKEDAQRVKEFIAKIVGNTTPAPTSKRKEKVRVSAPPLDTAQLA
jgi:hypothetical protein